jgi:hypothetical protein
LLGGLLVALAAAFEEPQIRDESRERRQIHVDRQRPDRGNDAERDEKRTAGRQLGCRS